MSSISVTALLVLLWRTRIQQLDYDEILKCRWNPHNMNYLVINSRQGGAPHPVLHLIKAVVYTSCLFLTPWKQDFFGSGRTLSWQDSESTADQKKTAETTQNTSSTFNPSASVWAHQS